MRASLVRTRIVTLAALALVACNDDDGPMDPPNNTEPIVLNALGRGDVTRRFTAEVWVRGNTAYTSTWGTRGAEQVPGNTIYVWDVAGDIPTLVDSVQVPLASTTGDVQVSDDGTLLVAPTEQAPGSIAVFSLANPRKPQLVSQFRSDKITRGVHTCEIQRVGGKLYAFLAINAASSHRSRLMIVDLSVPAQPTEVVTIDMGNPNLHDVFVRDGMLFTAEWNDGMSIWDIGGGNAGGSVTTPVKVGNVRTVGGAVHNIWWFHNPIGNDKKYVFVGQELFGAIPSSSAGDIHVVDISNPAQPREVAIYSVPGAGTHNFSMDEAQGILYAAYYNAGVHALDVRGDLSQCVASQKTTSGHCDLGAMERLRARGAQTSGVPVYVWGVQFLGGHVYASDMINGLWKLEAYDR
jgi:hypothetical protein